MMEKIDKELIVPTGEYISEWLEDNNVSQAELALRMSVSPKHVSLLVNGEASLSHEVAHKLSLATGVPADIWMAYENQYLHDLAAAEKYESLIEQADYVDKVPTTYLRHLGLVTETKRNTPALVGQLLQFFGVNDLLSIESLRKCSSAAFRKSSVSKDKPYELETWFKVGDKQVNISANSPVFNENLLIEILPQIKDFTLLDPREGILKSIDLLLTAGVFVCLTPPISGLGIHGTTRWVLNRPLVQLSLLWKTEDQMWFTLLHELGHVLLHPRGEFLSDQNCPQEAEANEFAAHFFVPEESLSKVPSEKDPVAVVELAKKLGISPAMVLGQSQRMLGDFSWGNSLKRKVSFKEPFPAVS